VTVTLTQGTPAETTRNVTISGWVFVPDAVPAESPVAIWYLGIPGATYRGLSYFDRQVPGYPAQEFSLARFQARHGVGVIVIDTLGTGESEIEVDGELITSSVTAEANLQVLQQVRERLTAGTLIPGLAPVPQDALFLAGIGHSMGAFQLTQLAVLLQDRGTPLDAAVFVGWSHGPWNFEWLGVDPDATMAAISATVSNGYLVGGRPLMRPFFYGPTPTVPQALIEADERDATMFPKGLMAEGMTPGIVVREAGRIRCPVLHVEASHDLGSSAQSEGRHYASTQLFTAYTQPQAAHCNFEASRNEYWRLLADWSRMVALSHTIQA